MLSLVHRASWAETEVSRWSLGSGEPSGAGERPGGGRGSELPVTGFLVGGLTSRCVLGCV